MKVSDDCRGTSVCIGELLDSTDLVHPSDSSIDDFSTKNQVSSPAEIPVVTQQHVNHVPYSVSIEDRLATLAPNGCQIQQNSTQGTDATHTTQNSATTIHPLHSAAAGLVASSLRTPNNGSGSEVELARRLGVRFDSSNAAWVARWVDPHSEKKKSRWFSVAKYGELSARRLAIQACLQNMKASEYPNFRDFENVLASFAATTGNNSSSVLVPGDSGTGHNPALFASHPFASGGNSPNVMMLDNGSFANKLMPQGPFMHQPSQFHHPFNACVPPISSYLAAAVAMASSGFLDLSQQQMVQYSGGLLCQGVPQDQAALGIACSDEDPLLCSVHHGGSVKTEDDDDEDDNEEDSQYQQAVRQDMVTPPQLMNETWASQQQPPPHLVIQTEDGAPPVLLPPLNGGMPGYFPSHHLMHQEPTASDHSTTASSSFGNYIPDTSGGAGSNTMQEGFETSIKSPLQSEQQPTNSGPPPMEQSFYLPQKESETPTYASGNEHLSVSSPQAILSTQTNPNGPTDSFIREGGFSSLSSSDDLGPRSEDDEDEMLAYRDPMKQHLDDDPERSNKKRKIDLPLDEALMQNMSNYLAMYPNSVGGSSSSSHPSENALSASAPTFHSPYYQMYHPLFPGQSSSPASSNNSTFPFLPGTPPYQFPLIHPAMHPGFLTPQQLEMAGRLYLPSTALQYHQFGDGMSGAGGLGYNGEPGEGGNFAGNGYKRLASSNASGSVTSPSSGGGGNSFSHHGLSAKMTCERGLHYSKNYRGSQECWIAVWNTKGGRIMHEAFDVTIMGFEQAKSKAREARDAAHSNNIAVAENSRPSWKSHSNTGIPHVSLDSQQLRFRAHKFGRRLCRSFSFGRRRGSFPTRESAFDAAVLWLIQTPTEEEIATVSGVSSKIEEPL